MTVVASTILDRVRRQLIDEKATKRWSDIELLAWLSDGQRTIVAMSPSYGEATANFSLTSGTKQTLPADTHTLLNVVRNMGRTGSVPGRAIRVVPVELLDTANPDWHSATKAEVVENYVFDPERPTLFYVYPPNSGTGIVELSRAIMPPDLAAITDPITVTDICQTALFDYIMARAHQKDSDYAAGDDKAQQYMAFFMAFMGQQTASMLAESPNTQLGAADLTSRGGAK